MTSSNGNLFRVTSHLCEEFTYSAPSHYPIQWWDIVNLKLRNKFQWKSIHFYWHKCIWKCCLRNGPQCVKEIPYGTSAVVTIRCVDAVWIYLATINIVWFMKDDILPFTSIMPLTVCRLCYMTKQTGMIPREWVTFVHFESSICMFITNIFDAYNGDFIRKI